MDGQRAAIVADFVDGIASEQTADFMVNASPLARDDDDENLMKKFGIPTGFKTTKVSSLSKFFQCLRMADFF